MSAYEAQTFPFMNDPREKRVIFYSCAMFLFFLVNIERILYISLTLKKNSILPFFTLKALKFSQLNITECNKVISGGALVSYFQLVSTSI